MAQGIVIFNSKMRVALFIMPVFIFLATFFILFNLERTQPLVHDEAVYLTKARSWQEGTPADEFKIYRPIGMAVAGRIFLQLNKAEETIRIFGIFFGALTAMFIYLLFERMFGWMTGASVATTIISSTLFLQNAPQFLNDIPSSGLLFGCLWVIWDWYKTGGRGKLIFLFAPFSALAFYLRYGVSSALVIIAGISVFILGVRFIKKKNVSFEKFFDTLILSMALFAPHFIESVLATKNILGILSRSGDAAGREYLGEGLLNYIKWLPNEIGGWLLGISSIVGIFAVIIVISKKKLRQEHIDLVWLGLIGLINFILIGVLVHAEPRYVFFPVVIFVGAGIGVIFKICSKIKQLEFFLLIFIFTISIFFGYKNYRETVVFFMDKMSGSRMAYVDASLAIKKDSGNSECAIWASSLRPELSWYSECHTLGIDNDDYLKKDFLINFRRLQYSVVFSKLKDKQLDDEKAKKYNITLNEIFRSKASQSVGDLVVYRIDGQDKNRFESIVEEEPIK